MRYAVITACRNEAFQMARLVASMSAQVLPPSMWVIVDDGSTDGTGDVARSLTSGLGNVLVAEMPTHGATRSFSSQVYAQQYGYDLSRAGKYDLVAFLDADIELPPHYYLRVSERFADNDGLGLAGGLLVDLAEDGHIDDVRRQSGDFHVPGGIQTFRRLAFEAIGGYLALPHGGQDTVADIMVAMQGWQVETLDGLQATHLRPLGVGGQATIRHGACLGRRAYSVGYTPLYLLAHCLRRARRTPWAELGKLAAYLQAALDPKVGLAVDPAVSSYFRNFQRRRLLSSFWLSGR